MIGARLATVAAGLMLAATPLSARDAREALIHGIEQEGHSSFAGLQTTIVIEPGKKIRRTEQVVERRAPDKLRIEYLAPPRLKGELVVDDGQHLRRYIPTLGVVEEGPSRLRRSLDHQSGRLRSLRQGKGTLTLVGENVLLGRKVTVVTVMPAKPDRPIRTLWLDEITGVTLRVEDRRPGDRTTITSFEKIDFAPILGDAEFQLVVPAGVTVVPERLGRPITLKHAEDVARRLWGGLPKPGKLPQGFVLTSAHQLSFRKRPVIALRYTRGRDDLSFFVSAAAGEPFSAPVQPRVNVVQRPIGGVLVTLVGSLPTAELEGIYRSIRLPDGSGLIQPPVASRGHR